MRRACLLAAGLVLLLLPAPTTAQADGRLNSREAGQAMAAVADLLEAAGMVVPELSRAGAPLQENFRQGIATLQTSPSRNHSGILYRMLVNAKAFLQLTDTLPKPPEFADDLDRQLTELRVAIRRFEDHFRATLDYREQQVLGADRDNLARYREANALAGPAGSAEPRVVFLGDSITDGWRLSQYFSRRSYLNRGISGQITGQMLGRMKPDVLDLSPKAVIVLGGTNDLARGASNATIRHNLESIGILAQASGVVPIMASILPVNDYREKDNPRFRRTPLRSPARIQDLNSWLAGLCESKRWVYLDYHSSMVDDAGRLRDGLSEDGLHPNAEGYKVMAPLAERAIADALQRRLSRLR